MISTVTRSIERDNFRWLRSVLVIEYQQLDQRGVLRKNAEVDAAIINRGAQWPA
jgi:hypothetical protein